jgi:hypothetical protein
MADGFSCAGPAVNGLFKIGQTVYAMIAVTEQAHDLLDSASHVTASVETVRSLRRQKSGLLQAEEKKWVDRVINDTEKTLNNVASLVEPARVDMQTNAGKIGLVNRALFVFRDSPKVATNFARLTLTSQSLNTALTMLSSREGARPGPTRLHPNIELSLLSTASPSQDGLQLPPSYQESEYLDRKRLQRSNPSSASLRTTSLSRASLFIPPITLDHRFTMFEPMLTSLSELPDDRKAQDQQSLSDGIQGSLRQHHGSIPGEILEFPIPSALKHVRRSKSSDESRVSLTLQGLPYPSSDNHEPHCFEMPEPKHYEYHSDSASYLGIETASQRSTPPPNPPYPTSDFNVLRSAQRSHSREPLPAGLNETPCEEREVSALNHTQDQSPTGFELGQLRAIEGLGETASLEVPRLHRRLTARERRNQWYTQTAS